MPIIRSNQAGLSLAAWFSASLPAVRVNDSNRFKQIQTVFRTKRGSILLRIGRVVLVQCFTSQFQTPLGDHTFFYRSEQDGLQTLQRHFALCSAANLKAEVQTVALLLILCETRGFFFLDQRHLAKGGSVNWFWW